MADKDLAEKYLESFSDVFADIYNVLLFRKEILLEEGLEEGRKEGRKEGKQLFLQCIRLKKQGFSKEKIAEECQVDIPEVEEILKEIEDL